MTHRSGDARRPFRGDEGFTLIEVVVSLVLLGIVATAALYFFLEGTKATSSLQRSQNAVAVANEAMERAYAINPLDNIISGDAGLVAGRAQADVEAAWLDLGTLGAEGVSDTYPLWDTSTPSVTDSDDAVVPLVYETTHSRQPYEVTTLVGVCFRSSNVVNTDQVCGKITGVPSAPAVTATPAGMVRMLRITAVVTWPGIAGQCSGGTCTYQLSGLVDRSTDLEWNQVIEPIAVDDFETFAFGESRAIDVLANDLMGPVPSSPVTIVAPPAAGRGTIASVATSGLITYVAPASASGKFTFTYRIKDARGAQSDPGTVEVTLLPKSTNDTVRVLSGASTTLPITGNDQGSPTSLTITVPPTNGSAVISGLNVSYTPSIASGGDSFRYTYTDASGQVSPDAVVTILIDNITVQDHLVQLPMRTTSADVWTSLTTTLFTGNADTSDLGITIVGIKPAEGTLRVGGATYNGNTATSTSARVTAVEYSPARNAVGEYTFQYRISNSAGGVSGTRTVTVRVLPVAVGDVLGNYNDQGTRNIPIGLNDTPNTYQSSTDTTVELGTLAAGCGTFDASQNRYQNGEVKVQLPNISAASSPKACSFTYTLTGRGSESFLRSSTVTVNFIVRDN